MSEPIFGIDLGTTNSCLAVLEPGGPRILPVDGEPIVPSVVSFERGETIVGRRARNRLALAPESTVRSIKRRMGESLPVELPDRALLPEEIAAEILRHIRIEGGRACGREVRRAVITVPAYFGDAQRRATLKAGELAGLEVVRLLNEPTAAALLYDRLALRGALDTPPAGPRRREPHGPAQRILVYDLGGGTFDVSVVEIGEDLNEVRASCGDNRLGGDDFDLLLARHLAERLGRGMAGDGAFDRDPRRRARLLDAAERAKIELSARPYARVIEEALAPGVHLDVEVERSRFEELIEPHLDRTLAEVDRALAEARLTAGEIDRVVLVGGSTSIPRVIERLAERFDCPVEHAVDPALGVALGAAVLGGILGGQVFDQILVDVSAHSLGIKTLDDLLSGPPSHAAPDHFSVILRRNTPIPATRSEVYYTTVEDQQIGSVEVYQGEDPRCSRNTLIGHFDFELAPAPANSPVVVELSYDLDGIIHVIAEQKGTGRRQEVTMSTRPDAADPADGGRRAVDNYILRKARALAEGLAADEPAGELAWRLRAAAAAYETALDEDDDAGIEATEADLLDLLEEAEEAAASGEP